MQTSERIREGKTYCEYSKQRKSKKCTITSDLAYLRRNTSIFQVQASDKAVFMLEQITVCLRKMGNNSNIAR